MKFGKFEINNLDDLLNIIKTSNENIFKMRENNNINLYLYASQYGLLDIIIFMTETLKCDINQTGNGGDTALTYAMFSKQLNVVNYFLNNHFDEIDFNQKDKFGNNLLLSSVYSDDPVVFDCIYDSNKFDINSKNNDGDSLLMLAAELGLLNIMKYLFEKYKWEDLNVNQLYLKAVEWRNMNIIKYLDETQDVNIFYINNSNETALGLALKTDKEIENKEITKYIRFRMKEAGNEFVRLKKKFEALKEITFE